MTAKGGEQVGIIPDAAELQPGMGRKTESACKPGSVVDSYSSKVCVATDL